MDILIENSPTSIQKSQPKCFAFCWPFCFFCSLLGGFFFYLPWGIFCLTFTDRTKNVSSNRGLPLDKETKEFLQSLKAIEDENRRLFGREYTESPYIFKWPNGKPISPDYVSHRFRKLLKKHGLEHIRFHDLRHANVKSRQTNFSSFFTYFHIGESISTFRRVTA